jgi:hypothetical protein
MRREGVHDAQKATDFLGISLHPVEVRSPDELDRGFSQIATSHVNAVLIAPDAMLLMRRTGCSIGIGWQGANDCLES